MASRAYIPPPRTQDDHAKLVSVRGWATYCDALRRIAGDFKGCHTTDGDVDRAYNNFADKYREVLGGNISYRQSGLSAVVMVDAAGYRLPPMGKDQDFVRLLWDECTPCCLDVRGGEIYAAPEGSILIFSDWAKGRVGTTYLEAGVIVESFECSVLVVYLDFVNMIFKSMYVGYDRAKDIVYPIPKLEGAGDVTCD